MPAVTYPNLGLVAGFATYESGWGDYISEDIKKLSILVQSGVIDKYTNEPGSPVEGDIILLNQSNVNNPNTLAIYMSGTWEYYVPMKGWLVYNRGQNYFEMFNGTAWTSVFGTTATTFAAGNDTRIVNALQSSAIGTTVQAQITAGTTAQYWRGDKSWQTLDKSAVGLANVDNTSDASKPISTATQSALDLKAPLASPTFTGTVSGITKSMVGLGNADNTSDANKPVSTAQQTALNGKEGTIAAGTTSQYWRGDKSWQTLNSTAVGLGNVNNTSDANKPVSTAQQSALDLKAPLASPTFTGTVTVPYLSVQAGSTTEGGELILQRGASQGLDGNLAIDTSGNTFRVFDNVTTSRMFSYDLVAGTATINGQTIYHTGNKPTKSDVGLANVDNTSDANKPVSTAQQTALNLKANLASPTFTGTVSGITASMVGLGSVENKSSATIRGEITSANVTTGLGFTPVTQGGGVGQGTNTVKIGWSGTRLKATVDVTDIGNIVFDSQLTKANVGLGNVDNTSDANKPVSTATQTALDGKVAVVGDSITGLIDFSRNSAEQFRLGYNTASALDTYISFFQTGTTRSAYIQSHRTNGLIIRNDVSVSNITISNAGDLTFNANEIWHAGSDGAGSGLDSDLLDGQQGTYYRDLANSTGTLPDARFTGTYTGLTELSSSRVRLTSTTDVSLASTAHAFQIGASTVENIAMDGNELQARNNGAAANMNINLSGGALVCGGEITAFSDRRLKSDIRTIENASDIVSNLRGVRYIKHGRESIGVIAQEVQEILPEVVIDTGDEDHTLAVNYGNMIAVLIEAVKDLQQEVARLKEDK